MRKILNSLIMVFMVTLLVTTHGLAQGKNRSTTFTLSDNLVVGETVLEKGEYRLKFDAQTSELHILRDGAVVKTVRTRVIEGERKSPYHTLETKQAEKGRLLVGVRFEGDRRTILVDDKSGGTEISEGQNEQPC